MKQQHLKARKQTKRQRKAAGPRNAAFHAWRLNGSLRNVAGRDYLGGIHIATPWVIK